MKDQILAGFVRDFRESFGLENESDSIVFENFSNYCLLTRYHCDSFELDQIRVGGGGDGAIDGVSIIVNDHVVTKIEEVEYFLTNHRTLEVSLVFIQAKTSAKFETAQMGNFFFGVQQFLSTAPDLPFNEEVKSLWKVKNYIYDRCTLNMRKNPALNMYYATPGEWIGDENQQAIVNSGVDRLESTNLFSTVKFRAVDSDFLRQIYRELKNQIETQIKFEKRSTLPEIEGVTEAYIGSLPCREFLKLIIDQNGELRKRLFYDNVRDFQGRNPVNSEISDSLSETKKQDRFVLLNNGITIVAKDLRTTGDNFTVIDYQIVNGCQTSHILFAQREALQSNTYLPVKIVVTADPDITNAVIKASNRQTEVKIEAFEALQDFHKNLEAFYGAMQSDSKDRIYYERRSKQYSGMPIKATQIVSIASQLKCFLAMFLDEPQSNHRYYGELLKSNEHKVFLADHEFDAYYASALCMCVYESALRRGIVPFFYRRFRFHFYLLFRVLVAGYSMPGLKTKKSSTYCSKIIEALCDTKTSDGILRECRRIIDDARKLHGHVSDIEVLRRKSFTEEILRRFVKREDGDSNQKPPSEFKPDTTMLGTIKVYLPSKGFGFISVDGMEDIFFHITETSIPWWRLTLSNVKVKFKTELSPKGVVATALELVSKQ